MNSIERQKKETALEMRRKLSRERDRDVASTVWNRPRMEQFAGLGVYLFAFAWPLGAYQRIIGPVHLHHMALVPVFMSVFWDFRHNKRLRTPFDLWWPCVAILALTVVLHNAITTIPPWRIAGLCLIFIAFAHVVRNRRTALRALQFSYISGCAVMVMSLLAQLNLLYPTAYSIETGHIMAGPYSAREGVATVIFFLLLTPALFVAARNGEFKPCRFAVASWLTLPAVMLLYIGVSPCIELYALQPAHVPFLFPGALIMALFLWGIARIAAKLWGARKFLAAGVYVWLVGALLAGVLAALWIAPLPTAGFVFLLAAIAGYGQPYVASGTSARLVPAMIILIVAVVAVNIAFLLPGDVRNYERFAKTSLVQGDLDAVSARLNFVKKVSPEETRADYYIARAYLAAGNLAGATQTFTRALRPARPRLLPVPDEMLIAEFLDEMRQKSSALPERLRGLAYEQALIVAGRERHALSLLELRGEPDRLVSELNLDTSAPKWPLAAALTAALNAPSLLDTFTQWDATLLTAILESAGPHSETVAAPKGFPDGMLPLVVMAQAAPDCDIILVFSPAGQTGGTRFRSTQRAFPEDFALMFSEPGWRQWRQNADGVWTLAFGMIAEVHIVNTPQVFFAAYPTQPEAFSGGLWETAVFVPARE